MKEFLSQAGVPFTIRNVETDLEAYRDLTRRGFRTVPVTLVGDGPSAAAVSGFDAIALAQALGLPAREPAP